MLDRFFAINRVFCRTLEPYLPQARTSILSLYEKVVAQYMNSGRDQIIVDVGGGKSCPFAKYKNTNANATIIAVDVSEEELKNNSDVDEKRVADAAQGLPFENEEVDLVVSRYLLEHIENLDGFVTNSEKCLKKGGYLIHLFPSKFAPFSLINQALPKKLSRELLYFFRPQYRGGAGFPAYYDKCYYSAIISLLEKRGFAIADVHLSYYQSHYFEFFVPLYLLSALYEILLQLVGAKNLCAYILIAARKK